MPEAGIAQGVPGSQWVTMGQRGSCQDHARGFMPHARAMSTQLSQGAEARSVGWAHVLPEDRAEAPPRRSSGQNL